VVNSQPGGQGAAGQLHRDQPEHTPAKTPKGRIFISKAVILLSLAKKSRDADRLQNFVYDQQAGLDPARHREKPVDSGIRPELLSHYPEITSPNRSGA